MECKIKDRHKLISDYLMGELPDDDAINFEKHYFQCETCFKELKIAEDAINLIKREGSAIFEKEPLQLLTEAEGKSSVKMGLKSIINKLRFPGLSTPGRWGIAFATVAALIFLIIFFNRNDQEIFDDKIASDDKKSLEGKDTLNETLQEPPEDKGFLAELSGPAFEPEPYLEEWINENIRSDSEIIDTVFSPVIGEKFYDEEITFKWNMNDKEPVFLKIINNREEEIVTLTPDVSQFPVVTIGIKPETFKKSGLYYWRIEDENEVLYVGKFYFFK